MLRKLRIKFIAVTMAMVAAVLIVSFVTICFTEYQRSLLSVEQTLSETIERSAMEEDLVDLEDDDRDDAESDDVDTDEAFENDKRDDGAFEGPRGRGANPHADMGPRHDMHQGEGFEIGGLKGSEQRFPIALFTIEDETLLPVSSFTTAYLSDDVLDSVSQKVFAASDGFGYDDATGLYYLKRFTHDHTYVAFADNSNTASWQSLALTLALVGLATLAVFFIASLFLSKWALKPVDEAWKSQRQFVTDASHELKTPLTVILANTSILLKHPDRSIASQSKWLESTQLEAQNMEGLVTEMLTLAQVESQPTTHREPIDLSDMVNGQILQFESVAFEQGFELESDIDDNVVVLGDRDRIRKLVSTLIENASKYVDAAGTVRISLTANDKEARYTVFNSGSFIAAEDLPHVFDRFYRTDKARSGDVGGFGLGLAIAREIARDHNGDIIAKSELGKGTTFEATISLRN